MKVTTNRDALSRDTLKLAWTILEDQCTFYAFSCERVAKKHATMMTELALALDPAGVAWVVKKAQKHQPGRAKNTFYIVPEGEE